MPSLPGAVNFAASAAKRSVAGSIPVSPCTPPAGGSEIYCVGQRREKGPPSSSPSRSCAPRSNAGVNLPRSLPQIVPRSRVSALIRFNRFYEQELREADKRFLAVYEMTLTEQRILLDLGDHPFGLTAVRICWDLKLNSGYVSRVLQKFRKYRLVEAERWDRDRRQQIVTLTKEGQRVYLDLRSFSRLRAENMWGYADVLQAARTSDLEVVGDAWRRAKRLLQLLDPLGRHVLEGFGHSLRRIRRLRRRIRWRRLRGG